ncbi:MAG: type II secretion system protein [Oscillospiraceae bacterium]|nr:type II secretion system protein [Oscillospiraceae bacterium]
MDKSKRKLRGFTLLELVVVMAILAVMAAVLIPSISGLLRSNKVKAANEQAQQVFMASQDYLVDLQLSGMKAKDLKAATTDKLLYIVFDNTPANPCNIDSATTNGGDSGTVATNMVTGICKRLEAGFEGSCLVAFYPDTFTVAYVCFNNTRDDSTSRIAAVKAKGVDPNDLYTSAFGGGLTVKDQEYDASKGNSTAYTGQAPIPGPTITI